MGQKRNRSSGGGNVNRNMRNINNAREVSRRTKGKNRYAYEEEMKSASRYYYDEDEYERKERRRKKASPGRQEMADAKRRSSKQDERNGRKRRRRGRRKNGISKGIGIALAILQFILSVVFAVNVVFFNMLTTTYLLILAGVLLILLGITLLTQIGARGKGIGGKIFCIFLCVVLAAGSFYIGKVNNAVQKITGRNTKTNSMVVAVLKDDPAQKITDAADYNFGVQYTSGADQTRSTVKQIEKDLDKSVEITEANNMIDLANKLYTREVDAIIYNSSFASIVTEQIDTFEQDIRIIYTHNIVITIENNNASDASVNEPFTVYLSGIDVEGDITTPSRSDVNILAVVNPKSHQVLLITTPRDYYVPIPGYSRGEPDKLTHAGTQGVEASMATLAQLYDTEIEMYGRVNFTSMIRIVDALGGLDVESDQEFDTGWEAGKQFHVNKGMNTFDGKETLAFCRERHALPDGDNDRGRHQQMVLTAMIKKMMSPAMLRAATDIIDSVSDGVDTNVTSEQIQTLIKNQLRTGASWNILSVAAVGDGDRLPCYSTGDTLPYVTVPDDQSVAEIKDMIQRVIDGEVLEDSVVAD